MNEDRFKTVCNTLQEGSEGFVENLHFLYPGLQLALHG